MSLSKRTAVLLFFLVSSNGVFASASVCPNRQNQPLRYIDVFDGEPAGLATLEPDMAKVHYGYWVLGYIYDEGRFVTIRCKYEGKQTHDVKLVKRVERCDYTINKRKVLRIMCK